MRLFQLSPWAVYALLAARFLIGSNEARLALGAQGGPHRRYGLQRTFLILGIVTKNPFLDCPLFHNLARIAGHGGRSILANRCQLGGRHGRTAAALINTGGNGVGLLAPSANAGH